MGTSVGIRKAGIGGNGCVTGFGDTSKWTEPRTFPDHDYTSGREVVTKRSDSGDWSDTRQNLEWSQLPVNRRTR